MEGAHDQRVLPVTPVRAVASPRWRRVPRRSLRAVPAVGPALACVLAFSPVAYGVDFEFQKLNRRYSQFVEDLAPVVLGPVEVTLRSPAHVLEVAGHRASLEPAGDGTHHVRVEIELSGHGTLDAVLRAAGLEGKLQDDLQLPLQTLRMEGRIALERGIDGYALTLLEAPEQVEVRIESQLAGRMVPLCRQMALVLVRFDCVALQESLSRVQVPIPGPPAEFLLPIDELTAEDRRRLDDYLETSAKRCCRSG